MTAAASRVGALVLVPAAAYVLVCLLAFLFQRSLIYFPSRWDDAAARRANPGYEEVRFKTSDGETLHGWLRRCDGAPWTVLVFHGNGGNMSVQDKQMEPFIELDLQVLLFDYRGYGLSTGAPTEAGLVLDGEAAASYLERQVRVPAERMVYYGKSLGSGVAVLTAARRPPARLILESSFDSMAAVGRHHYPYLPVGLFLRDRFDAAAAIGAIRCPVLVLHGAEDEIIPIARGQALFASAREPKRFVAIPGARHNDPPASLPPLYLAALREFLGLD